MSLEQVVPPPWPRSRWWIMIAFVFAVQLGCIFWLSDYTPLRPRLPAVAPTLRLAGPGSAELLALTDPTLFALPHQQGFSGHAWLEIWQPEFQPFAWTDAPRWLPLAPSQLGSTFNRFLETNAFEPLQAAAPLRAELTFPAPVPLPVLREHSTWRLSGDLARRRPTISPVLSAQTNADLLANSVVQAVVDAAGRPVSVTLLSSSGSKIADQQALEQTRATRFEPVALPDANPLSPAAAGLSWGQLIFEWRTQPLPPTNAPAVTIPP